MRYAAPQMNEEEQVEAGSINSGEDNEASLDVDREAQSAAIDQDADAAGEYQDAVSYLRSQLHDIEFALDD